MRSPLASQHDMTSKTDGATIRCLFAAGELVDGLFYFNYPGGSGLMSGAVFGCIAGTSAAVNVAR